MADLPFDQEVRARIADMAQRRAFAGAGPAPSAPAAKVSTGVKAPFYNRPVTVPNWLKGLGRASVPVSLGLGAVEAGSFLKNTAEPGIVSAIAGPPIAGPATRDYVARGSPSPILPTPATAAPTVGSIQTDVDNYDLQGASATSSPVGYGANALPYQPVQSEDTYDEQGNLVHRAITGSGTPTGYGAREPIVVPDLTGIGGLIGMKQAANANALNAKRGIAKATLEQNAVLKGPGMMGDQLALSMALEVAKRGGDPREVMAVLKGHPPVADIYATEPSVTGKADETRVRTNKHTGAVEQVKPAPVVQPITMAEAIASAKKNKTYKSDAQVRADMAKLPGYKLTD